MQTVPQTAKIIPFKPRHQPYTPPLSRSEWLSPGEKINITPELQMGIQYKFENGDWQTYFKLWFYGRRIRDCQLDSNHQLDLLPCRRLITRLATTYTDRATRPEKTLLVIENIAFTAQQ